MNQNFLAIVVSALVASIYIGAASAAQNCANDPVAQLGTNPAGIIKYWNYTAEEHWVTSEDGYIIHMVRITGKKDVTSNCTNKEPVIVHHGLLSTSTDWFVMDAPKNPGEGGALPFMLADAGYDVWLPSARGSTLSMNHTSLSISDLQFWQFSYDEMGKYDVPAMIQKVLNVTGKSQVSWIGHSMGTAVFFVASHYYPVQIKRQVRTMVALAPAADIGNTRSLVLKPLSLVPMQIPEAAFIAASNGACLPTNMNSMTNHYAAGVCASLGNATTNVVCQNALYAIAGFPKDGGYNMDDCNVARVVSHTPATTSIRCVTSFIQNVQSEKFSPQCNNIKNTNSASVALLDSLFSPGADAVNKAFGIMDSFSPAASSGRKKRDLGNVLGGLFDGLLGSLPLSGTIQTLNQTLNLNIKAINSCKPEYNLNNTQVPVLAMCGDSDSLVVTSDCQLTASKLGGPTDVVVIPNFEHLDFNYATNASNSVNVPVIAYLNANKLQCCNRF